jgi:crotonobetainyl-CoA:carnitine CoA-transferase CaiB-like acyl-CoA transferase
VARSEQRSDGADARGADSVELPLDGIRVVALEQAVAGPLCSRHMADLGADVVKVERPGRGDLARSYDTVVHGESAYFAWGNRGKRSVALDLGADEGRATLRALLDRSDVFMHNLAPGAIDRLGFNRHTVADTWPRLINCSLSGYGLEGPQRDRKAFDLLVQGESAVIALTGTPEVPCKVGISLADMSAGVYAATAILAALFQRERTGQGRFIDIALLDCLAEWTMPPAYHRLYGGSELPRVGSRHNMIVPYGVYRAGSGFVNFAVQTEDQWRRLCELVLERPELAGDPRFAANELRVRNREELEPLIEASFASQEPDAVVARLEAADVPFGKLNDLGGLLDHPQLRERGRWFEVDSPTGPVQALRSPINLVGAQERPGAIPALGQHTDEVLEELRAGAPRES